MTILTTDKLIELTSISDAVNADTLLPFIEMAETFHIEPIMGDMYETYLNKIYDNNLDDNDEKFLKKYVYKAIAYFAWYEAAPHLYIQSEKKGIVKKFSDNSNSIDSNDFKIYRQSIFDKAVKYANILTIQIEKDSCEENVRTKNSGGFFLNF